MKNTFTHLCAAGTVALSAACGTTSESARVALVVRLEAKPGHAADVEALLAGGLPIVEEEERTPYWFALKLGPSTYGIFDAFPDDRAREEHLAGKLAAALLAKAPELLAQPPSIEPTDILATKEITAPNTRFGVLARLEAKPGREAEVRALLEQGVGIVGDEPGTVVWFGLQLGPTTFGIFDAFPDDAARHAHLQGRLAEMLIARAPELLSAAPEIVPVDVLAAKLPLSNR